MFGIGKIISTVRTVAKLPSVIRKPIEDGRELKAAIDEAITRTSLAAEDGQITDEEIRKVGLAWINVAVEGNDLLPLVRRLWRLIGG